MFDFEFHSQHKKTRLLCIAETAGEVFEAAQGDVRVSTGDNHERYISVGHAHRMFTVAALYPEEGDPVVTLELSLDIVDEAVAYFTSYQGMFPKHVDAKIRVARKKWETLRKDGVLRFP